MDETRLLERLLRIEALHTGATTPGEKTAAANARERVLERLAAFEKIDPPIEYRFSMGDRWNRKVFVALLRRYGIMPYRRYRQRYTTVMARVSKSFVDDTLWPHFQKPSSTLEEYFDEVTERVVAKAICEDTSEATVVAEPPRLSSGEAGHEQEA